MEELINIIDHFTLPEKEFILNEKDELELFESACLLVEDLILKNPMNYMQPTFHETIANDVFEMLIQVFDKNTTTCMLAGNEEEEDYEEKYEELEHFIMTIVEGAMSLFYKHIAPRRSHKTTFVRKSRLGQSTEKIDQQLLYLKTVPQPEQRTNEWYAFRYKYLTASNIWKAFISQSTKNQLICEKCKPLISDTENVKEMIVNTESPMHWGNKYEPVSVSLYEKMYSTSVTEFGCIPHKTIAFLAASPDGINTDQSSGRYGRMLEVKNIVNREINGIPKLEYWIQMQLQLEVCDLKECDFLETRFTEYEDEEAFLADSKETVAAAADASSSSSSSSSSSIMPFTSKDDKYKGIILYFNNNGKPLYEYFIPFDEENKPGATLMDYQLWEESIMTKNAAFMWVKTLYWKLAEFSCVLVMRNKLWFAAATPDLYTIWAIIEKERVEGYAHRLPQKRVALNSGSGGTASTKNKYAAPPPDLQTKICYINMEAIHND